MDETQKIKQLEQANNELEKGNFFSAINLLTEILIFYKEPSVFLSKANCLIKMKKYEDAIDDIKNAINLDVNQIEAYLQLSLVYKKMGDITKALENLKSGEEKNKENSELKKEIQICEDLTEQKKNVEILLRYEKFEEALEKMEDLLKECSCDYELIGNIIQTYCYWGKVDIARKQLKKNEYNLRHYNENRFFVLNSLVLRFENKRAEAVRNLDKGFKSHKKCKMILEARNLLKNIDKLKTKAEKLYREKKYKESEELYHEIISKDKYNNLYNFDILLKIVTILNAQKQHELALKQIELAMTYKKKDALAHKTKALTLKSLKKYIEAEQAIRMANILDPKITTPYEIREITKLAKMAKRVDYYLILEITKEEATPQLIKKSYRKMAMKYHPDKNRGSDKELEEAKSKFQNLTEAYGILSDPVKKVKYDNGELDDEPEHHNNGQGMDMNDLFRNFFSGNGNNGFTFRFG